MGMETSIFVEIPSEVVKNDEGIGTDVASPTGKDDVDIIIEWHGNPQKSKILMLLDDVVDGLLKHAELCYA